MSRSRIGSEAIEPRPGEIWKEIRNTGGRYAVSNNGRVASFRNQRGWRRFPLILTQLSHHQGYKRVKLGGQRPIMVHRLVAEAFIPLDKTRLYVNHIDGDKANNHYSNLEWTNYSENQKHAYRVGLRQSRKGAQHHEAILNELQVINIRHCQGSASNRTLADLYGVPLQVIYRIMRRETWKHV